MTKQRNKRIIESKAQLHPEVYKLSRKYGPPETDLRQAEIADSYGSEEHAQRPIAHRVPEDVTDEDLDYYTGIYPHMALEDLVFYLYPIAIRFLHDPEFDRIDSFLYALNFKINQAHHRLDDREREDLKEGLHWLLDMHPTEAADWEWCRHLQRFMGLL